MWAELVNFANSADSAGSAQGALRQIQARMTKQMKLRLVRWVAIPLFVLGLRFADGGQVWNYMMNHLALTALLPLVVMFLVLVARGFYMQHRQQQGDSSKLDGAHNAKP